MLQTLGSETRNARILAQRLYGQCRKTASSWRALSPALRSMRNALEELEDLILDEALGKKSTSQIFTSIQSCVKALKDLDRHLQFYRCSAARWQAEISETVKEVNAGLSTATAFLKAAYTNDVAQQAILTPPASSPQDPEPPASDKLAAVISTETRSHSPAFNIPVILEQDEDSPEDGSPKSPELLLSSRPESRVPSPLTIAHIAKPVIALEDKHQANLGLAIAGVDDPQSTSAILEDTPSSSEQRSAMKDEPSQQPADALQQLAENPANIPLPPSPASQIELHFHDQPKVEEVETLPRDSQKLLLTPETRAALQLPPLQDWRSPFGEVDPLSVDFESATSFLLGTSRPSSELLIASSSADSALLRVQSEVGEKGEMRLDTSEHNVQTEVDVEPRHAVSERSGSQQAGADITLQSWPHRAPPPLPGTEETRTFGSGVGEPVQALRTTDIVEPDLTVIEPSETTSADLVATIPLPNDTTSDSVCDVAPHADGVDPVMPEQVAAEKSTSSQLEAQSRVATTENVETLDSFARTCQSLDISTMFNEAEPSDEAGTAVVLTNDCSPSAELCLGKRSIIASTNDGNDDQHNVDSPMRASTTSSRTDSKIDLKFSAPASPQDSSADAAVPADETKSEVAYRALTAPATPRLVQTAPISPTSLFMVNTDTDRRASDSALGQIIASHRQVRPLSDTSVTPRTDVLGALGHALVPPPPPPKGRYHIVNPTSLSRSSSLERAAEDTASKPVSPVSSRASGDIPMILVQESSEDTAVLLSRTSETSQSIAAAASESNVDTQAPSSFPDSTGAETILKSAASPPLLGRRYYRQDLNKRGNSRRTNSQDTVSSTTDAPQAVSTVAAHSNIKVETPQEPYLDVETIRIESICQAWSRKEWSRAEAYLLGMLDSLMEKKDIMSTRRIRHLLGVSASFQGQWQRAISYFISALNAPLKEACQMDEGDRAALIWLSDCYVLSNRRLEAFIANALALQGFTAQKQKSSLSSILAAEQKAILSGGSIAQLELKWNQLTVQQIAQAKDTIVSRGITSPNLVEICFNSPTGSPSPLPKHNPLLPRNRATILCELDNYNMPLAEYMNFKFTRESLQESGKWPMPYDPFFAAEQASKGRLCDRPCNLLAMLSSTPALKIPKNGPLGSSRFDCFTCSELEWLVKSVRDCLTFLEMKWDEVANSQGIWFSARFAMKHRNVLTANYFAISLFKQSMRQGYGIEVCVDGVRSARVIHESPDYPMGVHHQCEKRLKKFFKDYLTRAHRLWVKNGKPATNLSATEVASGELAKEASTLVAKGLPLPPRTGLTLYA